VLLNKTVIISGASRGLGYCIARSFIMAGYKNLVIIARSQLDLLNAKSLLDDEKISEKQKIIPIVCDISIEEDVVNLSKYCSDNFQSVDVLINNASVFGPINFFENSDFSSYLGLKVKGRIHKS